MGTSSAFGDKLMTPEFTEPCHCDAALNATHLHHHKYLHHSTLAEEGHENEVAPTMDTTFGKSNVYDASPIDHDRHKNDGSKDKANADVEEIPAGEGLKPSRWSRYKKQRRVA